MGLEDTKRSAKRVLPSTLDDPAPRRDVSVSLWYKAGVRAGELYRLRNVHACATHSLSQLSRNDCFKTASRYRRWSSLAW